MPPCPPKESAEAFRCYVPSKRRYSYSPRVHLVVSGAGEPVEFALKAGPEPTLQYLGTSDWTLPKGSTITADKEYTGYDYEDLIKEIGSHLKAQHKKNSKRPMPAWEEFQRNRSATTHRDGFQPLGREIGKLRRTPRQLRPPAGLGLWCRRSLL